MRQFNIRDISIKQIKSKSTEHSCKREIKFCMRQTSESISRQYFIADERTHLIPRHDLAPLPNATKYRLRLSPASVFGFSNERSGIKD